jgi:hypothetical protein
VTGSEVSILIDEALKTGYKLSTWERSFVENVKNLFKLSVKQEYFVRQIYEKATDIDCRMKSIARVR